MIPHEYSYAIGAGYGVALLSLTNIESLIAYPPTILKQDAVQGIGPVRRMSIGKRTTYNGTRKTIWNFAALSKADFNTLITTLFTNYTTPDALVTINTRYVDWSMKRYNATVAQPQLGQDYTQNFGGSVEDLKLTFYIIGDFL